jgi:hypothetical protein
MKRHVILFAVLAAIACALPVSAQTVTNPDRVLFTASVDHASLTKYVVGFFAAGATAPLMEQDIALGTPDAQQIVTQPINARPLAFGAAYVLKVRAVAGTVTSEWSEASNAFDRIPLAPSLPVVRR